MALMIIMQKNQVIVTSKQNKSLETLVENWRITSIDLSQNNIGKAGALALGKALKEKGGHIEWIE